MIKLNCTWDIRIIYAWVYLADINECSTGSHFCAQICTNTIGSYTCSCGIGYRLNGDGFNCSG